jgi:hypothetical protein
VDGYVFAMKPLGMGSRSPPSCDGSLVVVATCLCLTEKALHLERAENIRFPVFALRVREV